MKIDKKTRTSIVNIIEDLYNDKQYIKDTYKDYKNLNDFVDNGLIAVLEDGSEALINLEEEDPIIVSINGEEVTNNKLPLKDKEAILDLIYNTIIELDAENIEEQLLFDDEFEIIEEENNDELELLDEEQPIEEEVEEVEEKQPQYEDPTLNKIANLDSSKFNEYLDLFIEGQAQEIVNKMKKTITEPDEIVSGILNSMLFEIDGIIYDMVIDMEDYGKIIIAPKDSDSYEYIEIDIDPGVISRLIDKLYENL